ncbi:DoxX protein [Pseudarcicella hirudinis]|uniref:DoxX protein n=1 Tax=Pseudarcicella hirudinis TaxID=1079859 RepID=A0A1I5VWI4_9BACT|nr:DoxX family membrane protein [Pseudarcicella hirudinis]SFQ11647.1 DoxX protein [Pseudarcicella hirudinis]
MNTIIYVIRLLLSLLFVWHGAEKLIWHHPVPVNEVNNSFVVFYNLLAESGYIYFIGFCQLLSGLLLIFKKTYLLAVIMLIPMVLNLIACHVFLSHQTGYIIFDTTILLLLLFLIRMNYQVLQKIFLREF